MGALETTWLAQSRPGHVLYLAPNRDPNREEILEAFRSEVRPGVDQIVDHLPRPTFLSLLKRIAALPGGSLIGNSSAGLIECAALGMPVINLGPRQAGRERGSNVFTWAERHRVFPADVEFDQVLAKVDRHIRSAHKRRPVHPFGDGHAGIRIARLLAKHEGDWDVLRKRNSY
jgi:UDP-N-acetylglucosamine 2-epimerase